MRPGILLCLGKIRVTSLQRKHPKVESQHSSIHFIIFIYLLHLVIVHLKRVIKYDNIQDNTFSHLLGEPQSFYSYKC